MNQYVLQLGTEPFNGGQLAQMKSLLLEVGNLIVGGTIQSIDPTTNEFLITTPWRQTLSGSYPDGMNLTLILEDRMHTEEQYLIDRPIVKAGDTILALSTVTLASELSDELVITRQGVSPADNSRLTIGIANTDAQDGIYATPFSIADQFVILRPTTASVTPTANNTAAVAVQNNPVL